MSLILKNVKVCDQFSRFHNSIVDLAINSGLIEAIEVPGKLVGSGFDLNSNIIAPGLIDLFCHFNDPGLEHKEDIRSGLDAALMGGFTHVCIIPNTVPSLDTKGAIEYTQSVSSSHVVDLMAYGAISSELKGENMSEILDLHVAGAIAFTEGINPIKNAELLLKALQYTQKFNGLIVSRPRDPKLTRFGQINEGIVSTKLGLTGITNLSEELAVSRDLKLLKYAGGRIHFSGISTGGSIELIKEAKQEGLNVTCDVSIHQLLFTDSDLESFDTNYKVMPPLRTEKDQESLFLGLTSGAIDAICSDHQPQDSESKNLEFDLASFGMINLQTVIPSLLSISDKVEFELLLNKMNCGPRKILELPEVKIEVGEKAELTFIDTEMEWQFDSSTNQSKSRNTPLYGNKLKGKSIGIINGGKTYFDKSVQRC